MNLYAGQPESDDSCVATDLEQRYKMFLAEGFTPAEALREAKEIIKFEWLVDQGRDQDQAALLVQMPLRSMMMTTFSQKPADLGYPARVQWLLDRGLYTYEEATVFAFQKFDILVVMHDEVELAAGRQHRIQYYFADSRRNIPAKRKPTIHPQFGIGFGPPAAKVAAVKPTFRYMASPQLSTEIASSRSCQPPTLPFTMFSNLDRLLKAPSPKLEEVAPPVVVPEVVAVPVPSSSKTPAKKDAVPNAKPAFKWSWKSGARSNLTLVPAVFGAEDEEIASMSTLPDVVIPELNEVSKVDAVPVIPKIFNVPPPPLPIPPPAGSQAIDPALLKQPVFAEAVPMVLPSVEIAATPELPKPHEPEPEPVFKISTVTTGPKKPVNQSKYTWVNPNSSGQSKAPEAPPEEPPRPIPSLAAPTTTSKPAFDAPRPIPSLAAVAVKNDAPKSVPATANLNWSSTIPTINTRGNTIVMTPTVPTPDSYGWNRAASSARIPAEPKKSDEFSLNWDKAWGVDKGTSSGTGRWASFKPAEDIEEDPNNPYGVPLLNTRAQPTAPVPRSASPSANKVDDLYAMMNRFDGK